MRSILLSAIGIPLPIILILWLVTGHVIHSCPVQLAALKVSLHDKGGLRNMRETRNRDFDQIGRVTYGLVCRSHSQRRT